MSSYKTVKNSSEEVFIEKKSRFIGYSKPVKTQEEATDFIKEIREKNPQANHNVYAYSLKEGNISRYSDDGEPQGSAGIPVLSVLQKGEIIDAVIVVTRYFGGILLGGGGLVRAYSHAASLALKSANPVVMQNCTAYKLKCDYNRYLKAQSHIEECGGCLSDTIFEDLVTLCFHINPDNTESLLVKLNDLTNGKVNMEEVGSGFYPIDL